MWTMNVNSIVFTRIKHNTESKLKSKYPGLNFTSSNAKPSKPSFPTVYIHEMPGRENGNDLEGSTVNFISSSFQIEVTDAGSEMVVKEVMKEIVKCMKGMRFSVTTFPEFQNTDGYFRCLARFGRNIGQDDIL